MTKKSWKKSRTLWFNAFCMGLIALEASTGVLKPVLGENFYVWMAGLLPVVNAFLRAFTSQPIKQSKAKDTAEGQQPT